MTDEGLIKLLGLADFLECDVAAAQKRSGKRKLRMDKWFDPGDTKLKAPSLEVKGCGTRACALGWATVAFPRAGLRIKCALCRGGCGNPDCEIIDTGVNFGDAKDLAAAQVFFSLDSHSEACDLFAPQVAGNSLKAVVRRIREFVAKKWEAQAETSA